MEAYKRLMNEEAAEAYDALYEGRIKAMGGE